MREILKRKLFATGIGSLPHTDAKTACRVVLKNFKDIPFWPQLAKRSFLENMYTQFTEGLPGTVIDIKKNTVSINTEGDFTKHLAESYQKVLDNDMEYFAVTKARAEGLYILLNELKTNHPNIIKGHITGPVSFGMTVTDEKKKAIFYHPELSEILTKILVLKTRWQTKKLKELSENVIIFIDEPYLVSIGSSVVNIKPLDASAKIKELVDAVHQEGGLAGAHCCGNTDWSLLLKTDIDILNFDAYNYAKSVSLYPGEVKGFLDKGGMLAWGIVPTSDAVNKEDAASLIKRLEDGFKLLIDKGISKDKLLDSLMVTPSCGTGTMEVKAAERVLSMTAAVSEELKKKYL